MKGVRTLFVLNIVLVGEREQVDPTWHKIFEILIKLIFDNLRIYRTIKMKAIMVVVKLNSRLFLVARGNI